MFVPEAGIRNARLGRRTVRLVGEFEFRGHAPEALKIVVAPGLLAKNVHHKSAEIEQRPFGGALSLAMFGRTTELLVKLRFDFSPYSWHLRSAKSLTDHQIFCE